MKNELRKERIKELWLNTRGGRNTSDVEKDERGEYILTGDGSHGFKKTYLPSMKIMEKESIPGKFARKTICNQIMRGINERIRCKHIRRKVRKIKNISGLYRIEESDWKIVELLECKECKQLKTCI